MAIPAVTDVIRAAVSAFALGGASSRTVKKLAAAHSNNTVTLGNVTDGTNPWTFSVVADTSYLFKVLASYQTAALTTGAKLAVTASGGAVGNIHGSAWGAIGQATLATGLEASPIRQPD